MPELTYRKLLVVWAAVTVALGSSAYIGPGVGAGAFILLVAVVLGVVLLVAGFLWYPVKRMLRSRKSTQDTPQSTDA